MSNPVGDRGFAAVLPLISSVRQLISAASRDLADSESARYVLS
ncbi:MAG TPA: hypothetical protein VGP24_10005 [Glaciihabitans sp.]|nr:hypothetical protein [Glaciihabitans sp.]